MHLFISWSGGRSHRLAGAMKAWLESHFPDEITAFVSSEIEKGRQWFPAVESQLRKADAGLVCLTPESLKSDWVAFEAGALATAVALHKREARIFTYLLDLRPASLPGPLAAYQSTVATMDDTLRLVNSLLSYLKIKPKAPASFADQWDDLQMRLAAIGPQPVTSVFPQLSTLFDRKTFHEPVDECMDQSWFQRYDGAIATREALRAQADLVVAECGETAAEMFRELLAQVDGYAMDMRALLFKPETFDLTDAGRRAVPSGIRTALEHRRAAVHGLAAQLTDQRQQPVVPEAYRFDQAASFAEKKGIIHRIEQRLETAKDRSSSESDTGIDSMTSDWTLDRITAYLVGERSQRDPDRALAAARRELELVRAADQPSLLALHYSLRWIQATPWLDSSVAPHVRKLVVELREFLNEHRLDTGGQLRALLAEIDPPVVTPE
jgi:TIR domain